MAIVFLHGALCHPALRRVVIGRDLATRPAMLAQYSVGVTGPGAFPILVGGAGDAAGEVADDLADDEIARLRYFLDEADAVETEVSLGDGTRRRVLAFPARDKAADVRTFDPEIWRAAWSETATATAVDIMRGMGRAPRGDLTARQAQMLTRGGARVRAGTAAPETLRSVRNPGDVEVLAHRQPYASYFAVEEFDLRFRNFDGGMSKTVTRAVFISGDAAVVLPYDPARDRVLLIEQFRPGPQARGAANPWLIEAVAGRIDGGETPEAAAYREAEEEAGLTLAALIPVANYYPSPAAKAEYIYSYIGIADLSGEGGRIGGLDDEGEDIRAHVVSLDRLMELVRDGEVDNAPLILLAYWLQANRAQLRQDRGLEVERPTP